VAYLPGRGGPALDRLLASDASPYRDGHPTRAIGHGLTCPGDRHASDAYTYPAAARAHTHPGLALCPGDRVGLADGPG
jgi:hypothetical protein